MNPILEALKSLTQKAGKTPVANMLPGGSLVTSGPTIGDIAKMLIYDSNSKKVAPMSPIHKMTGQPEDTQDIAMNIGMMMGGVQSRNPILNQSVRSILSKQGDDIQRAIDASLERVHQSAYTNPQGIDDWAQLDKTNKILGSRKETPEVMRSAMETLTRQTSGLGSLDDIQALNEGTKRPLLYQFSKAKGNAEKEAILKHMKIFGGYEDIIPNLKSSMRTVQISPETQSQIDFMKAHGGRVK